MNRSIFLGVCLGSLFFLFAGWMRQAEGDQSSLESFVPASRPVRFPREVGHPTFASPHAKPIAVCGNRVFVVNTPADTVDVIDSESQDLVARINVGVDPVSLAVRPDQKEVWVSNHVSDSVNVIDNDQESPTYLHVIATIQMLDEPSRSTRFDEPAGIAFASNSKAYVALSSENAIAVVDVATRKIEKRITIPAQDPRAIVVNGDRLYVIPFESNNQTQLSGGTGEIDGDLVTFNAWEHSIAHNNVLSLGHVVDIVKHPQVPDRDLFVFDTETDELLESVDTLGTLLYGMCVDSNGSVFIAQTDARNDVNGRSGTKKHGLAELQNRAFLNRITRVDFDAESGQATSRFFDLEPLPPETFDPAMALATPFAIELTDDDQTLIVSAAGSDKLFTVDAKTGDVLGRVKVDAVPRGIAIESANEGRTTRAWVYNAIANTVSLVGLDDRTKPGVINTITLDDPTHPTVKKGRIAFETARSSTTETYACASCHPDGHTDQLLWVLKTPIVTGGDQIMPRSTMPIRGLRDTAPFHWDGVPGDPYGGNNSASIHASVSPNCDPNDPLSSARHLIDGGISGTMSLVGDETVNDEGKAGALSAAERDAMAMFLLSVPYPPAQRRAYTNTVSDRAVEGFKLFHVDGDHDEKPRPNVCGNCHRMPYLVSTNTPGTGMDAPTWRGAYDRFLILPQGRLNIIDFDFYRPMAEAGQPERSIWQMSWGGRPRFDPVWEMVLEGSTGFSGAFARQFTLDSTTFDQPLAIDMLRAFERSASEDAIVLEAEGVITDEASSQTLTLQYVPDSQDGRYVSKSDRELVFTRQELVDGAAHGKFVGTFTARHGANADVEHPQPALWTLGPIEQQRGRQEFPILHRGNLTMTISGRHIAHDAYVIIDGRRVNGSVSVNDEQVEVELSELPSMGMHLMQVQNANGMFSNDFIFYVVETAESVAQLQWDLDEPHVGLQDRLNEAVARADMAGVKGLLGRGAKVNGRHPDDGGTPLSTAALHGNTDIARDLIQSGANVDATNRDGNTALHIAAFLCRKEMLQMLLDHGASIEVTNSRGERPVDVVSAPWNESLAGFYRVIETVTGIDLELGRIEKTRPEIAEILKEYRSTLQLDPTE